MYVLGFNAVFAQAHGFSRALDDERRIIKYTHLQKIKSQDDLNRCDEYWDGTKGCMIEHYVSEFRPCR